jgi:hypothetical protein
MFKERGNGRMSDNLRLREVINSLLVARYHAAGTRDGDVLRYFIDMALELARSKAAAGLRQGEHCRVIKMKPSPRHPDRNRREKSLAGQLQKSQ